MMIGEIFEYRILDIIEEEELKRFVKVKLKRDFYDGIKEEEVYFFKDKWDSIKANMKYTNRDPVEGWIKYEYMTDEEFYKWKYTKHISQFSDEELVEELNNRIESRFHSISIKTELLCGRRKNE